MKFPLLHYLSGSLPKERATRGRSFPCKLKFIIAPDIVLSDVLAFGIAVLNGSKDLNAPNDRSLKWRGKQRFSSGA